MVMVHAIVGLGLIIILSMLKCSVANVQSKLQDEGEQFTSFLQDDTKSRKVLTQVKKVARTGYCG
jgi:hypothetical protein